MAANAAQWHLPLITQHQHLPNWRGEEPRKHPAGSVNGLFA